MALAEQRGGHGSEFARPTLLGDVNIRAIQYFRAFCVAVPGLYT